MYTRQMPCLCASCRGAQFTNCQNTALVGRFKKTVMKKKGTRVPKTRYVTDENDEADDGAWVVTGVHGKRYWRGKLQYLLAWQGYDEMTFVDVDKLSCFELVEKYELNQEEGEEQEEEDEWEGDEGEE